MGKKQFNARLDEDIVEQVRSMDISNTEAMEGAFKLFLRANGMMDAESIRTDIRDIDREMQRVRREANQELASLADQRDNLVETLEWRERQEDLVGMTLEEIAEGLANHPNENIRAYQEQTEFLVAHSNGPHNLQEIQAKVRDFAQENELPVRMAQLYPDQFDAGASTASTDGSGDVEIDTSRYALEDDDE